MLFSRKESKNKVKRFSELRTQRSVEGAASVMLVNVEHGHVPHSGTGTGMGTGTFRERFSVKILHKRCSSFRERSGSGNGSGNMATKVMLIAQSVSNESTSCLTNCSMDEIAQPC